MLNQGKSPTEDVQEIELSNAQDWLINEPEQIITLEEILRSEVDCWH